MFFPTPYEPTRPVPTLLKKTYAIATASSSIRSSRQSSQCYSVFPKPPPRRHLQVKNLSQSLLRGRAPHGPARMFTGLASRLALFVCLVAGLGLGTASAAVLQVNGSGILTGATGVVVNGQFYNVSFQEGSCGSLFSGCDSPSDFFFTDRTVALSASRALAASRALLGQVFLDVPAGAFDTNDALTFGCAKHTFPACDALTPYASKPFLGPLSSTFEYAFAENNVSEAEDFAGAGPSELISSSSIREPAFVFAIWTPGSAPTVPAPGSVALLTAGLLALSLTLRRRTSIR